MRLIKLLLRRWLLLALLGATPAAWSATPDADAFVAASRSQQARLLETWAAAPVPARLALLQTLDAEALTKDPSGHAFSAAGQPLGMAVRPAGPLKKVRLTNRLRNLNAAALASHRLVSDSVTERRQAAAALLFDATPSMAPLLDRRRQEEGDRAAREALDMALAVLQLASPEATQRQQAAQQLGSSGDPRMQARLRPLTDPAREPVAAVRAAAQQSLESIDRQLAFGELLGQIFSGLSLGSVLLLAALGLAITYGLLGVINMAHGEMLMLGAYAGWMVQNAFARLAPQWLEWWPLAALPVAFMMTAAVGMALERTVIRHLYGRPLETLLATWGISLMLIQAVRMLVGPQNVEVANPGWLSGGIQLLPNLILPWNRLAVLLFVLLALGFCWLILNRTRLGLHIRAVTQNRAMASCCGVPVGRVDMLAFGLGSGIAGLGGVALTQLGNVGPELGQSYIIDSFLVVVLGGVGQLAGSVVAAFGLGIFNKLLEPQVGAVLGKILILMLVVLFIQKRPQGLFAPKGRVTE